MRGAALTLAVLAMVVVAGLAAAGPWPDVQWDRPGGDRESRPITHAGAEDRRRAGVQRRNHSHSEGGSDHHDRRHEREQLPPGSGYEKYTETPAGDDAKFVVVQTHVVNNAKTSLDLTCSFPVSTKLVDDQERQFDPIDDLYKLEGNPECNDQLQPGFESDMTWVYRVPSTANVVGWAFQDFTDFAAPPPQWTAVRLQT